MMGLTIGLSWENTEEHAYNYEKYLGFRDLKDLSFLWN